MKTGMQPDMKISLVRRDDAESPGIIRQNTVSRMVSRTYTRHCLSLGYATRMDHLWNQRPQGTKQFPSNSRPSWACFSGSRAMHQR